MLEEVYGPISNITGLIKYCSANGINTKEDLPICEKDGCHNYAGYNKAYTNRGFSRYCSPICSRSDKTISKEAMSKLNDYDWFYNERITLRKSWSAIGGILNISETTVKRFAVQHNLPDVRYNESIYSTMQILNSKESLSALYSEGDTLEKIADKIGTSKATLSRFMRKHSIGMRPNNSYDRKIKKVSASELNLREFIKSLDVKLEYNKRNYINGELDIYIPDHKLALEFNGLYWHSDKFKPNDYHITKTKRAIEAGISLFHIWEDDWTLKPNIVKSMIKHKLGKSTHRVYARKTSIEEVSGSESRFFLDENHIQGYTNASIKLGLFFESQLVALMTFNKPRFNKKYDWELVRYAVKQDHNIIGGFSKLLKYFRETHKGSIITYADSSYSNGNVYSKNGFTLIKNNPPAYWYVLMNKGIRVSRTKFTRKRLSEFNANMSEKDIMRALNVPRIYNCGTQTYGLI